MAGAGSADGSGAGRKAEQSAAATAVGIPPARSRAEELQRLVEPVRANLEAVNTAREQGLAACRRTIRACGSAIRCVHRLQPDRAASFVEEAGTALSEAQTALSPHPALAHAGFLHDAEKEYAEAQLTVALVSGAPLPSVDEVCVGVPAWLNGLAEAASELRRHLLDRLRGGELERAESLLIAMEEVYDLLVTIDYPDAMTGGLRRTTDALRAVLERSRSDLTVTLLQSRLQAAIEAGIRTTVDYPRTAPGV